MGWLPSLRRSPKRDQDDARRETLAEVRGMRANFEDAIQRAAGAQPVIDIKRVLADFTDIEREIAEASVDDLESFQDRAERLERLRAYVYPSAQI